MCINIHSCYSCVLWRWRGIARSCWSTDRRLHNERDPIADQRQPHLVDLCGGLRREPVYRTLRKRYHEVRVLEGSALGDEAEVADPSNVSRSVGVE